jgi:hypothetical protein
LCVDILSIPPTPLSELLSTTMASNIQTDCEFRSFSAES